MKKNVKKTISLRPLVGSNLKAYRMMRGLTQSQVAQKLGVEVETISRYERGSLAPSFLQLEKLCAILDTPAWVLFFSGIDPSNEGAMRIAESLRGLPARELEFFVAYVKLYREFH